MASNCLFGGPANRIDGLSCSSSSQAFLERCFRAIAEPAPGRRNWWDGNGICSVSNVAVQLCRHIDFDQVTRMDHALPRNTMRSLVIERDARSSRKAIDELRRRASTM